MYLPLSTDCKILAMALTQVWLRACEKIVFCKLTCENLQNEKQANLSSDRRRRGRRRRGRRRRGRRRLGRRRRRRSQTSNSR